MKKSITITMDQFTGEISYDTGEEGFRPTGAEALGMIEFAKFLIYCEMREED